MVSTRGGTRTSGPDADMTLKKKPVRKTTAKTTTAAAPKARVTRAKKTEPEPEPELEDDEDELAEPNPAPIKPATKRGRPAVKKDEELTKKAPVPRTTTTKAPTASKTAAKTTRTATTRNTKVKVAEDEQAEQAEGPSRSKKAPELKPSQSRATRPTRATAAKERAAPLSPKKITQVSKAPLKKSATAKPATAKSAPATTATRGRPATRKRNVSDENAGVPELHLDAEEAIETQQTAASKAKTPKKSTPLAVVLDDETPMSTRPTTPADSTQQTIDEPELDNEDAQDEESGDELQAEEGSDDELCAPKTPMKRCDPQEQAKYSPAKGTSLSDVDVPLNTPVRRFHVLGTQQGTPQTQKPYCKPTVPMSEVRPMTVARARDTAMVFPRLQPLQAAKTSVHEAPSSPAQRKEINTDDASAFEEQDSDLSLLVDASTQDIPVSDLEVVETAGMNDPEQARQAHDPDETIGDEDMDENDADFQRDASLDSINSVLVTRQEADVVEESEDDSVEVDDIHSTPRPETMAWENLREDITIPFEFDGNASPTRTLPQAEPTERLSIAATFVSETRNRESEVEISFNPDLSMSRQSNGVTRQSLDATVNLSDFVDVSAITEQTDTDMADAEADIDTVMAKNPTVEDIAEEDTSAIDGDVTLMCNEPSTPLPATRTPVRLTTAEVVAEDSAAVDGDMTLLLDEPACPATIRRSPVKLATAEEFFEDDSIVEGDMTLAIDEPTCPRTIRRSPVKLTMAEDVPEESETVEGDMTLMLDSPLPQQPETPALLNETRDSNVTPLDLEALNTPRYARSTISSRRKSVSDSSRPTTADGERMPVNTQPAAEAWFDKVDSPAKGTPRGSRPGTAQGSRSRSRSASRPRTPAARTPAANGHVSVKSTTKERFPGLPAQQSYEALIGTPIAKSATKERFPGMPPAESYQELLNSPAPKTPITVQTPSARTPVMRASSLKRKSPHDEDEFDMQAAPSPQQALPERFPGMPSRPTYEAHTAMPATRFRTPSRQSPIKRPATTQKPTSLRKIALKAASTPMKAPLKAPAETPGQVPMTPHPSAPLRDVIALVDVYTHDGVCASQSFAMLLKRLGAKTTKTFNENVTHVVYKEGGPKVLSALRIHNKQVAESGKGREIFCVNSRWVNDCDAQGHRMPETDEEYAVELDDYQRTAKRRRKSMEPMSLLKTNGGNIIRDRKSSAGRVSIGRASMKGVFDSPEETSMFNVADKENSEDGSEPATPAYLKEPSALIQQTVPAKKMHKLDFGNDSKQRRLTFADGLEF